MNHVNSALLQDMMKKGQLWRGRSMAATEPIIATGFAELDDALGGGWPETGLIEIFSVHQLEMMLLLPLLAHKSRANAWVIWVQPPCLPYAPALADQGVDVGKMLLVSPGDAQQALWAAEQSLRSSACSLLLCWVGGVRLRDLRRLQLAAEIGRSLGVLWRPETAIQAVSPVAWRLHVRRSEEQMQITVLKRKRGWGGRTLRLPCSG